VAIFAGKRTVINVMYAHPDGVMERELQRFDACRPAQLALLRGKGLQLKAIIFPAIDGLRVSVDPVTKNAIDRVEHFKTGSGGFVSEITPDDAFMATPGLFFKGTPPGQSVQMEFCVAGGGAL
jgi:hypothetical protein